MADVQAIPDGYPRISPYLIVDGADAAVEFYGSVLGTIERMRMPMPDGTIAHCELQLGESVVMLADEQPEMDIRGPKTIGGSPVTLSVYVQDVDTTFSLAIQSGAKPIREVETQFYGDRSGEFEDPFGHRWNVASHVEDVPPEEMGRRAAAAMAGDDNSG